MSFLNQMVLWIRNSLPFPIELEEGEKITCLELKNEVREHLWSYSESKGAKFIHKYEGKYGFYEHEFTNEEKKNLIASNALVNHFLSQTEDLVGTQKGALVNGGVAKFLMGWSRFFSFDGILNITGNNAQVGAALTAKRAEKFSEYLRRAPHLKGMVKMFLIALFPWLVFFVVAGRWKVLISWYAIYVSVLMWTPIWTLLYHLMTSIALSTETMYEFGKLSDGISLYSASFITAKMYQFYAIYSWLQLLVGPLPTLLLTFGFFNSFLRDSEGESAPEPVNIAKDVGVSVATGGSPQSAITKRI